MGYSYDAATGQLCCDVCDKHGGVRKFRCPFGWCQAIALCPDCRKQRPELVSAAYHRERGCEAQHLKYQKLDEERQAMLAAGKFVRSAALWHPKRPGLNVKVFFQGGVGHRGEAYWMRQETYDAIPILDVNATPDDYRKHGEVVDAKSINIYDAELEPVKV